LKTLFLFAILAFISSCTPSVETVDTAPEPSYCTTEVAEISQCTTSTTYTGGITVTGTAGFYRRTVELNNPPGSGLTLGPKASGVLPIKYAEIRVLSGSTVVQCGKTDATGAIKAVNGTSDLQVPAGSYTIQVLSRVNHSVPVPGGKPAFSAYASVKKEICANELHTVSANFSTASPTVTLTADSDEVADPEIAGGAFNIYNDIITSYEYLANNTGVQDLSCLSPKLEVFWKAGFNPSQYIYPSLDPNDLDGLSFYLRGYNQLYINGGKLGNVSTEDTDHFDDAVVIHELGHRIEDVCGRMDSPGGTHYGLFRTDPRLAWSEGWGNFFGAHIIKNNLAAINPDAAPALGADGWVYYLDTTGYNDNLIQLDLTRPGNNPEVFSVSQDLHYDKVDSGAHPGEGHFREVSISRSLFKSTNSCTVNCTNQNYFAQMWQAFRSMASSSYPFRSSVRFYNRLNAIGSLPAVDAVLSEEAQQRDGNAAYTSGAAKTWVPYGVKLAISATPCSLKLQPREEYYNVTFNLSDQRYSNHFYHIDRLTLPTVTGITMIALKEAGTNLDIDLILYQDGYSFPTETCLAENSQGDCTTYAKKTSSPEFVRSDRSTGLTKTIGTINALSANTAYLLNVKAFTAGKTITDSTQYSYELTTQNGEYLCPSTF
jgi:hypothetical protein